MNWIRNRPFRDQNEAIQHMITLLAKEAESSGTPLSEEEKNILAGQTTVPNDLRGRAKNLIRGILIKEDREGLGAWKSFGNSLQWVDDYPLDPNIALLTEETVVEGRAVGIFPQPAELHGWGFVKDKLQLVGFGLLLVIAIFIVGWLLSSKWDDSRARTPALTAAQS
jgi:hypothetical protein